MLGIFWDVTERKVIEEQLRHERELLRALLDACPDAIYFKDANGRFIRMNHAMAARLNLATFVTTWMDPEASALMAESFDKNMIDKDEYPQTAALETRCVNILAEDQEALCRSFAASGDCLDVRIAQDSPIVRGDVRSRESVADGHGRGAERREVQGQRRGGGRATVAGRAG